MVDGQLLAARLGTAVLASVMVTLENVPAAEGHVGHRQPVIVGQRDHFRHPQLEPHRPDAILAVAGPQLGPVLPGVKLVVGRVHDVGRLVPQQHQHRAALATFTGCQLRFKISVGR